MMLLPCYVDAVAYSVATGRRCKVGIEIQRRSRREKGHVKAADGFSIHGGNKSTRKSLK